mgnify:CR=1 FL=1
MAPALCAEPTASATPEPSQRVAPATRRIVLLPIDFIVYENTASHVEEAQPEWSETAASNLADAARAVLARKGGFEIVPPPAFELASPRALAEHRALVKVILQASNENVKRTGGAWAEKIAQSDYSIGDGLAGLAEAAGADLAFVGAGEQVSRSTGSVLTQVAMLGVGFGSWYKGGTSFGAAIIDLRTGDLRWCNSLNDMSWVGMGYRDVRTSADATALVDELFREFPVSRLHRKPML